MKKIIILISLLISISGAFEPECHLYGILYDEVLTLTDPEGRIIDSYGTKVLEFLNKDSTLKILVVSEPKDDNYEIDAIFVNEVTYFGGKMELSVSRSPNGTVKSEYVEYDEFSNLIVRENHEITYSNMVKLYKDINHHIDYGTDEMQNHRSKRKKEHLKKMYI